MRGLLKILLLFRGQKVRGFQIFTKFFWIGVLDNFSLEGIVSEISWYRWFLNTRRQWGQWGQWGGAKLKKKPPRYSKMGGYKGYFKDV